MCCSSVTNHEEAFPAAFPVSNEGEPNYKILDIYVFLILWLVLPLLQNKSGRDVLFLGNKP